MKNLNDMHYDAFISYRHLEPDSFVAQTLHKRLEAFKLPRSAREKADSGKTRIERIFRDEEELPLSEDLSDPINNALANSEFLICVCTPRYLESRWCMREIETFLQTHDRNHILVVLAEGEPDTSFPEILTQDGREPLAADTRGGTKKEILKKMNTAVLRISAAMFGLNYDDLKQRHREAKLRRLMALGSVIGVAVLAFAVFATVTLVRISRQNAEISEQNRRISKQKDTIATQYNDLQEKYADQMVESAKQTLGRGRREDAIRDLKSVLPESKEQPYNVNVMRLLYETLDIYKIDDKRVPLQIYEDETEVNSFDVSADGMYVLLIGNSKVRVYDSVSSELVREIERKSEGADSVFFAGFCGTGGIIVVDGAERRYCPFGDGRNTDEEDVLLPDEIDKYTSFFSDPDAEETIVCGPDSLLAIGASGEEDYRIDLADIFNKTGFEIADICFDKTFAVATAADGKNTYILVFDRSTGKPVYHCSLKEEDVVATVSGNTLYYASPGEMDEGTKACTRVIAADIRSGEKKWETDLPDRTVTEVVRDKDMLYIVGTSVVSALTASGDFLSTSYTDMLIEETWTESGELYYLCQSGKLYSYFGGTSSEVSDLYFQFAPTQEAAKAMRVGDALFYMPAYTDYVVKYVPDRSDMAEEIGEDYTEKEYYSDPELMLFADDVTGDIKGIDPATVAEVFLSNDRKYICLNCMQSLVIADAGTHQILQTLEVSTDEYDGMRYSEFTKGYILDTRTESLLLDGEFNILCETGRIVDEEADGFITRNEDYVYYRVPYVSYDELAALLRDEG